MLSAPPSSSSTARTNEIRFPHPEDQNGGELLPGPRLGSGPVWKVPAGKGAAGVGRDWPDGGALFRCNALLEQALSCSPFADVRFVFDDGESGVSGHRAMLCSVSGEFEAMFRSGMVEAETGEVRVRGVGRASFRGFLEYLYLGRAGKEMGLADGREVWMLADFYNVEGVKNHLTELSDEGLCAAVHFALEGAGGFLEDGESDEEIDHHPIIYGCGFHLFESRALSGIGEEALKGVSAKAAGMVLKEFFNVWCNDDDGPERYEDEDDDEDDEDGGGADGVIEGFKFVVRWARANGGLCYGNEDVALLVGLIFLDAICPRDLMDIVRPSGLLRDCDVDGLYQRRMGAMTMSFGRLEGRHLGVVKSFKMAGPVGWCASGVQGGEQRLAVSDIMRNHVVVWDVASGARVMTVGSGEEGLGKLSMPTFSAFNDQGELFVADNGHKRVCVYGLSGEFVREIGNSGMEYERVSTVGGVAVTSRGSIVVSDPENRRHVMYERDGAFVDALGERRFTRPASVAAGPDDKIAVVYPEDRRMRVLDASAPDEDDEVLLTIGSGGRGPGQFRQPNGVAISPQGEILVSDSARHDLQLFTAEGRFMRSFDASDIGVRKLCPVSVSIDAQGGVFVVDSVRECAHARVKRAGRLELQWVRLE